MNDQTISSLGTVIGNAMIRAAQTEALRRGVDLRRCNAAGLDRLAAALKVESRAVLDGFLADGKALDRGGFGGWLETLLATHVQDGARRAVDAFLAPTAGSV